MTGSGWILILLVCATPPSQGYDGCARWAIKMPDERTCHHAGRRWIRSGQSSAYRCQISTDREEQGA